MQRQQIRDAGREAERVGEPVGPRTLSAESSASPAISSVGVVRSLCIGAQQREEYDATKMVQVLLSGLSYADR